MRPYTIWKFTSPSTGESRTVARVSEPSEENYTHAYQAIVARVQAIGAGDALRQYVSRK